MADDFSAVWSRAVEACLTFGGAVRLLELLPEGSGYQAIVQVDRGSTASDDDHWALVRRVVQALQEDARILKVHELVDYRPRRLNSE